MAPFYPRWDQERSNALVAELELPARRRFKHLSQGMQTKLALALALSHLAELVVMDEIRERWALVKGPPEPADRVIGPAFHGLRRCEVSFRVVTSDAAAARRRRPRRAREPGGHRGARGEEENVSTCRSLTALGMKRPAGPGAQGAIGFLAITPLPLAPFLPFNYRWGFGAGAARFPILLRVAAAIGGGSTIRTYCY